MDATVDNEAETSTVTIAARELRAFVERVERLAEERREISARIKEAFDEAKGRGFDVKALRALLAERAKDPDEIAEAEAVLDLYRAALAGV